MLLPWLPNVFLLNGSQKSEDETVNRENGQEATQFETRLTVIYRDTRGS